MRLLHQFLGVKFTIKDYVRTELPEDEENADEITENNIGDDESEDLEKELADEDEDIFGTKKDIISKKEELDTDKEKPR